jgi:hypothetical protein
MDVPKRAAIPPDRRPCRVQNDDVGVGHNLQS